MIEHNFYEKKAWAQERLVCGIDEVGRGCLAGSLTLGFAVLPSGAEHLKLIDSKKLSEKMRVQVCQWIKTNAFSFTIDVTWQQINQYNVNQATLWGILQGLSRLKNTFGNFAQIEYFLIDFMRLPSLQGLLLSDQSVICAAKGESWSSSIAAASIVAKVQRDQVCTDLSPHYPLYDFAKNKSYAASEHVRNIVNYGSSVIHRDKYVSTLIRNHNEKRQQIIV